MENACLPLNRGEATISFPYNKKYFSLSIHPQNRLLGNTLGDTVSLWVRCRQITALEPTKA
jgi:hypothetical protein